MSEEQGLNEEDINHFRKKFLKNVEFEIFQLLKTYL